MTARVPPVLVTGGTGRVGRIIPGRRAQLGYVARLTFELVASYSPALREALPERFDVNLPSSPRLLLQLLAHAARTITRDGTSRLPIALAPILGRAWGAWMSHDHAPPRWVARLVRSLYGVEAV